jgi:hypothetical protein
VLHKKRYVTLLIYGQHLKPRQRQGANKDEQKADDDTIKTISNIAVRIQYVHGNIKDFARVLS